MTGPSGTEIILVVDDDQAVLSVTSALLSRSGYTVLEAASGAKALDICAGCETAVDLLLTDVIMPNMTGPQLADRLLSLYPRIRVLFMSGYEDYQFEKYRPFPFKCFMRKPFTPNVLLTAVREVLDTPRKREPGRQEPEDDIRKAGS